MTLERQPIVRKQHPAESIPDRPHLVPAPQSEPPAEEAPKPELVEEAPKPELVETQRITQVPQSAPPLQRASPYIAMHHVRIRQETKARITRAALQINATNGNREMSEARLTDEAINAHLDQLGL